MTEEKIDRINVLAHKQKSVGLTESEKAEQAALRREYINDIKSSLVGHLENTYIVDKNGNRKKVSKKGTGNEKTDNYRRS